MVINSLADILNLLTAFLSLFFAFYLLTLKSKYQLSNVLIAFYLIIGAIDSGTVITGQFIFPNYPGLGLLISTSLFLSPPLLYFYIYSMTYKGFKLKPYHLFHVIPFILTIILLIPRFYMAEYDEKIRILSANDDIIVEMKLVYLILHVQVFAYIIAGFVVIHKSKKLLLENYSNGNTNYYNWLITLLSLIALEVIVSTFKNVFLVYNLDVQYELAKTLTSLTALLFICWLVIKALKTPELYDKVDAKLPLVKQLISKNVLNNEEVDKDIKKLMNYMNNKQPFLEPSLSIYDLSKQLDMPTKELSILINHNLNQHFFDFVNEYRIKKAMELLSDPRKSDLTVLEILYDVGFNSKSSFNTAFKKHTKLTPTQYRKKHML